MDQNTTGNNPNVNNVNPMNNAIGGNAAKGCFGMGKMGCIGIAVLAALAMWVYSGYNSLVTKEEGVKTAWSQVENQYQRRIDLIKNVAASAKKYANTEKEIQLGTANARAHNNTGNAADQQMQAVAATADSLARVKMDPNNAQSMQQYAAAQDKMLEQARLAINVVHEAYPELKSDKLFENLQVQLEGTENRVATERKKFNETARDYNTDIRKFPGNILAKFFGFNERPYFAAQEGADKAPDLDNMFDN
jgi:LemA protein